ncbi:MAG: flagellar hook capping FlgD N-terminal domain-containing protein [Deltaproteobacteria bacterium]
MATTNVTYSSVPWLQSATSATNTTSSSTNSASSLGKDDFLKLLITELAAQDPLEPMDDKEFISQMSSFSALEQMQNMNAGFTSLKSVITDTLIPNIMMQQSSSLIGQQVSYPGTDKDGKAVTLTGTVDKVVVADGKTYCMVNGTKVDPSIITEIGTVSNSQIDELIDKLDDLMGILVPEEGAEDDI